MDSEGTDLGVWRPSDSGLLAGADNKNQDHPGEEASCNMFANLKPPGLAAEC